MLFKYRNQFARIKLVLHHRIHHIAQPESLIQVTQGPWSTQPLDVQTTFNNLPLSEEDKKLFWVEGTNKRFDGYNYFGEHPDMMIEWFGKYMA